MTAYASVNNESDAWSSEKWISFTFAQKKEGLIVKDWLDWDGDTPSVNPEAEWQKETGSSLGGTTLYFGYAAEEGAEATPVGINDITITYGGEAVTDQQVTYKQNDKASDYIEFAFYQRGDYVVSYTDEAGDTSSVTITVDYDNVAFYTTDQLTTDGYLRGTVDYCRTESKTVYVVARLEDDWESISYEITSEDVYDTDKNYITVKGSTPEEQTTPGVAEITIEDTAACGFNIKVVGTITHKDGTIDEWKPETWLWCNDTYEGVPVYGDDKECSGFDGCFITEKAYKDMSSWDNGASGIQYWVHADTAQEVIDQLMSLAATGTVQVNGTAYDISNTGYIYIDANYDPDNEEYVANGTAPQYITTSDIKGIVLGNGFFAYSFDDETYGYVEIRKFRGPNDEITLGCIYNEEGNTYKTVTGSAEEGFTIDEEGTTYTDETLAEQNYEDVTNEYGYGRTCLWPELHVDATANIKIPAMFDTIEGKANLYLGYYKDSDVTAEIVSGDWTEETGTPVTTIGAADIDKATTISVEYENVKAQVVELKAEMSVENDYVDSDKITLDNAPEGKALRDMLDIEQLISTNAEVKQAIMDGDTIQAKLNIQVIESDDTTNTEAVNTAIDKLSEETAKDTTISKVQYLNTGLSYQIGTGESAVTGTVADINESISVQLTLPEEFAQPADSTATSWTPVVYRYNGEAAEKIDSTYVDGVLSFAVDKLSVYAIAITETLPADDGNDNTGSGSTGSGTTGSGTTGSGTTGSGTTGSGTTGSGTTGSGTTGSTGGGTTGNTGSGATGSTGSGATGNTGNGATGSTGTTGNKGSGTTAKVDISKATSKIKVSGVTNQIYTGKKIKLSKLVVKAGNKTLKSGTDYTVSYKNNKNIGKATVTITGKGAYKGTIKKTFAIKAKKGKTYTVKKMKYKITKVASNGKGTVTLTGTTYKKSAKAFTKLKIGSTVTIGGVKFKVTAIGNNAFKGYKKLKSVTIGANVKTIGKNAFNGCTKLGTVTIKSKKLTAKNVGAKAFKGIKSNAKIKIVKSKYKAYKKFLSKKGLSKKVKYSKA